MDLIFHVLYGLHSRIPACCIRAFVRDESSVEMGRGYATCRLCAEGGCHVEVHICSSDRPLCRLFDKWCAIRSRKAWRAMERAGWRPMGVGPITYWMPPEDAA